MSMPRRDPNHITGDRAARRVQDLFDPWPVRLVESNDYGVDAEVEIFDEVGQATGLTFKAQVKGSAKQQRGRAPKVQIKTSSLNYWLTLDVPVLVCYVALASGDLYARWAHSYDPVVSRSAKAKKSGEQPKYTTFTFSPSDKVTAYPHAQIVKEVQAVRALRQRLHAGPLHFRIEYADADLENESFSFEQSLHLSFSDLNNIVLFDGDESGMLGTLRIERDKYRVALPVELGSFTIHTQVLERLKVKDESLAADVLVTLAVLFARMGLNGPAVTLAKRVQLQSEMPISAEIAGPLAAAATQHADYDTAVQLLAAPLVGPSEADRELAEWLLAPLHHFYIDRLSEAGVDVFVHALSTRMELEQSLGRPEEAGRFAYTRASIQRNSRPPRFEDALASYAEVAQLAPSYEERAYFHQEIGGVHADCGRWFSAFDSYKIAKELNDHPDGLDFYMVDTLAHCGRYADALAAAEDELTDSEPFKLRTELWAIALRWWTELVHHQDRHQLAEDAFEQLGQERAIDELIRVLASTDVLDQKLHAPIALTSIGNEDVEDGALAIALTSALVTLDEPYPWVMAIHLLLKLNYSRDLAEVAADQLVRFAPATIQDALAQYRGSTSGDEYTELSRLIRRRMRQGPPTPPRTIRIMLPDGSWDEAEL